MTDHERIWLEPAPGEDNPDYGRQWCQDNVWGDEATEYVRADLAEITTLRKELAEARAVTPEKIAAACKATVLGEDEHYKPIHLSEREARVALVAALSLSSVRSAGASSEELAKIEPIHPDFIDALAATRCIIADFEKTYPELYWHIAKGKITAGEPLYGALITNNLGVEIGHGESDVSAEVAFELAISSSGLPPLRPPSKAKGEKK